MGEYADDAIHAGLDQSWGWRRPPYSPRPQTCKRCGQKGLYWHEYAEGWRLQEAIHFTSQWGEQIQWVKHKCPLGIKGAFAQMKLDKDPGIAYNAYLDTIPWPDSYDRR